MSLGGTICILQRLKKKKTTLDCERKMLREKFDRRVEIFLPSAVR